MITLLCSNKFIKRGHRLESNSSSQEHQATSVQGWDKALCALIDTVPLYLLVHWLRGYLHLESGEYAISQPDEVAPTP